MDFSEAYRCTLPPAFSPDGAYVAAAVEYRLVIREVETLKVAPGACMQRRRHCTRTASLRHRPHGIARPSPRLRSTCPRPTPGPLSRPLPGPAAAGGAAVLMPRQNPPRGVVSRLALRPVRPVRPRDGASLVGRGRRVGLQDRRGPRGRGALPLVRAAGAARRAMCCDGGRVHAAMRRRPTPPRAALPQLLACPPTPPPLYPPRPHLSGPLTACQF